jgi:hypothetical protein
MTTPIEPESKLDLRPYAGRWIALVRDRVAGVGRSPAEAAALAKGARSKDEPLIVFVPEDFSND